VDVPAGLLGEITNRQEQGLTDLNLREQWTVIPLIVHAFWIGLYPKPFLPHDGADR